MNDEARQDLIRREEDEHILSGTVAMATKATIVHRMSRAGVLPRRSRRPARQRLHEQHLVRPACVSFTCVRVDASVDAVSVRRATSDAMSIDTTDLEATTTDRIDVRLRRAMEAQHGVQFLSSASVVLESLLCSIKPFLQFWHVVHINFGDVLGHANPHAKVHGLGDCEQILVRISDNDVLRSVDGAHADAWTASATSGTEMNRWRARAPEHELILVLDDVAGKRQVWIKYHELVVHNSTPGYS
mmetsp:Transcript_4175/g.15420  ORF Transcript_4175/g.15420 Transcript_4175/m.15420 type:complete len:244 (-) Transcript_4175:782-1513(-)